MTLYFKKEGFFMSYYFSEKTWEELQEYIDKDAVIVLPVGQTEEHGKHLPVFTDAKLVEIFADEIGKALCDEMPILIMPAVWAGYSPKKMNKWPGCMMVQPETFTSYVYDICRSLVEMGFKKVVMLDGHGQHAPMLNIVTKKIADEFNLYFAVTSPLTFSLEGFNKIRQSPRGGVLHACEWETSVIMAYSDLVKTDKFTDIDAMKYHSDFVAGDSAMSGQKVTWSTWGLQQSETGVYGDPTTATAEKGKQIVAAAVEKYKAFLHEYFNFKYKD